MEVPRSSQVTAAPGLSISPISPPKDNRSETTPTTVPATIPSSSSLVHDNAFDVLSVDEDVRQESIASTSSHAKPVSPDTTTSFNHHNSSSSSSKSSSSSTTRTNSDEHVGSQSNTKPKAKTSSPLKQSTIKHFFNATNQTTAKSRQVNAENKENQVTGNPNSGMTVETTARGAASQISLRTTTSTVTSQTVAAINTTLLSVLSDEEKDDQKKPNTTNGEWKTRSNRQKRKTDLGIKQKNGRYVTRSSPSSPAASAPPSPSKMQQDDTPILLSGPTTPTRQQGKDLEQECKQNKKTRSSSPKMAEAKENVIGLYPGLAMEAMATDTEEQDQPVPSPAMWQPRTGPAKSMGGLVGMTNDKDSREAPRPGTDRGTQLGEEKEIKINREAQGTRATNEMKNELGDFPGTDETIAKSLKKNEKIDLTISEGEGSDDDFVTVLDKKKRRKERQKARHKKAYKGKQTSRSEQRSRPERKEDVDRVSESKMGAESKQAETHKQVRSAATVATRKIKASVMSPKKSNITARKRARPLKQMVMKFKSKIHGIGMKAVGRIPLDMELDEYGGEILTRSQYEARYPHGHSLGNFYTLEAVEGRVFIDAIDPKIGNWTRYINHAPKDVANVAFIAAGNKVLIVTLRDIEDGEELLVYYGEGFEALLEAERNCEGDSQQRSGVIAAEEMETKRMREQDLPEYNAVAAVQQRIREINSQVEDRTDGAEGSRKLLRQAALDHGAINPIWSAKAAAAEKRMVRKDMAEEPGVVAIMNQERLTDAAGKIELHPVTVVIQPSYMHENVELNPVTAVKYFGMVAPLVSGRRNRPPSEMLTRFLTTLFRTDAESRRGMLSEEKQALLKVRATSLDVWIADKPVDDQPHDWRRLPWDFRARGTAVKNSLLKIRIMLSPVPGRSAAEVAKSMQDNMQAAAAGTCIRVKQAEVGANGVGTATDIIKCRIGLSATQSLSRQLAAAGIADEAWTGAQIEPTVGSDFMSKHVIYLSRGYMECLAHPVLEKGHPEIWMAQPKWCYSCTTFGKEMGRDRCCRDCKTSGLGTEGPLCLRCYGRHGSIEKSKQCRAEAPRFCVLCGGTHQALQCKRARSCDWVAAKDMAFYAKAARVRGARHERDAGDDQRGQAEIRARDMIQRDGDEKKGDGLSRSMQDEQEERRSGAGRPTNSGRALYSQVLAGRGGGSTQTTAQSVRATRNDGTLVSGIPIALASTATTHPHQSAYANTARNNHDDSPVNYRAEMEESFRRLQKEMMENMERMMQRMISTMMTSMVAMLTPLIQGNKKAEAEIVNQGRALARAAGEMHMAEEKKQQVVAMTQRKIQQWARPTGQVESSAGGLVERQGEEKEEKSTDPKHKDSTSSSVTATVTAPRRSRQAGPTQSATDEQTAKTVNRESTSSRQSVLSESEIEDDDLMEEDQEGDIVLSEPEEEASGVSAHASAEKNV